MVSSAECFLSTLSFLDFLQQAYLNLWNIAGAFSELAGTFINFSSKKKELKSQLKKTTRKENKKQSCKKVNCDFLIQWIWKSSSCPRHYITKWQEKHASNLFHSYDNIKYLIYKCHYAIVSIYLPFLHCLMMGTNKPSEWEELRT